MALFPGLTLSREERAVLALLSSKLARPARRDPPRQACLRPDGHAPVASTRPDADPRARGSTKSFPYPEGPARARCASARTSASRRRTWLGSFALGQPWSPAGSRAGTCRRRRWTSCSGWSVIFRRASPTFGAAPR